MPVPTRRLAAVAAALAVLVLMSPLAPVATVVALDLALLATAFGDWWLAVRPADVPLERELPAVLALGGRSELTWRVGNPSSRRLWVGLADDLAPSLGASTRRARLVVPPRGRTAARAVLEPTRRGRFVISEVVLRVEGPLGLAARQGRRPLPATLRVYPPFHSREEAELRINRARILEIGLRSAAGRGGGTEFDSLREYSVDDEFRRIDWAATARASKTIVRTYRAERNQTVIILLDTGRMMAGRVAGVPRLDHAMDVAMMLTAVATRLGDRAGLVAFDSQVRAVVPPGHGPAQLGRVTEAMYTLDPRLVESDYRGVFAQTLARFRRRALLVVLTELAEEAVAETLVPALPVVVRHDLVVVGSVTDPEVAGWSRAVPADASATYRKAAAVKALAERQRTVARLRAMGATVVDALPGKIAPALADAYLRVKATGRL